MSSFKKVGPDRQDVKFCGRRNTFNHYDDMLAFALTFTAAVSLNRVPTGASHLKVMTFYGMDLDRQQGWTNV